MCCDMNLRMGGQHVKLFGAAERAAGAMNTTGELLTCVIGQQRRLLASVAAAAQALSTAARIAAMPDAAAGRWTPTAGAGGPAAMLDVVTGC